MNINKITANNYSFKSNRQEHLEYSHKPQIYTGKTAKALVAALAILSAQAKADVINIQQAAFDCAQKEYARLKKYDTNNDGLLDEKEQIRLTKTSTAQPIQKTKISNEKIQLAKKLVNLINGKNEDGSAPPKTFFNVHETLNFSKAKDCILNEITVAEFIELNSISNNLLIDKLIEKCGVYVSSSDILKILNNRLIDYRLKNLPTDFRPIANFKKESGFFQEIIDTGLFSDTHTGKYKFVNDRDFRKNVNYLCKNPKIKEQYANNFVYVLNSISNATDHGVYLDQEALVKLLLPSTNINK